jgi:hypothetical protein
MQNLLNSTTTLDSLNQVQNDIHNIYLLFQKYLPLTSKVFEQGTLDKYGTAIFGLLGVLVGGLITYLINKKLNQEQRISQIKIQRKNLIYSPIYKELLSLKKYLNDNNGIYYIKIINNTDYYEHDMDYYFDGERKDAGMFISWNEMKNDIRNNYIPENIKKDLENINQALLRYNGEIASIDEKFKKLWENINNLYKKANKKIDPDHGDTNIGIEPYYCFYKSNYECSDKIEKIENSYTRWKGVKEGEDFINALKELYLNLPQKINRDRLFEYYNEVKNAIIRADEDINILITDIIKKYES